jgi:hypothetical protein
VFYAGGFSDAGETSAVEIWGADPLHRGGEPEFSTSEKVRKNVGSMHTSDHEGYSARK